MVITPWGESGSLRERRLQPVRGAASAEVERNQRERLFAALVASVAERGYAATTVADLVEISGVSSRSFYDHFGDMQGCVKAVVEELVEMGQRTLLGGEEAADPEAEMQRRYDAFAALVHEQPGAAKLLLSEVFVAGPKALAPIERAIARYEREIQAHYESTPERLGMPSQIIAAIVGGILEVARTRLREDRAEELSALGPEIVAVGMSYRPPPEPLRLGVRQKGATKENLEAPDHSERAIRSFAVLCDEQGYQATTVDDVVKLAGMSSRTFYGHFSGKEDLMEAAIDNACAMMVATAMPAFSRHRDWPAGIRAAIGAMLGFLASRPALARLLMVEVYVAGDFAIQRRSRGLEQLGLLLENNTTEWQLMPPIAYEMIAGGAGRLVYREMVRTGSQGLPGLAPFLAYLILAPFLGPEEACSFANGSGGRPEGLGGSWMPVAGRGSIPLPTRMRSSASIAVAALHERTEMRGEAGLTAAELAEEIGEEAAVVEGYLRELTAAGVVKEVEDSETEAGTRYRSIAPVHRTHIVTKQQTEQMSLQDRQALSEQVKQGIFVDVEASIRSHAFDRRPERFLTRTPMKLDEQGWQELADLHAQTLLTGVQISARSAERLASSGEEPIEGRSVQMMFEMPGELDEPAE